VAGSPPSNVQNQLVAFSEEVFSKVTCSGPHPLVLPAVKFAEGAVVTVTVCVEVTVPQLFVALSVTVYTPSAA
jgi:hypothetical protein